MKEENQQRGPEKRRPQPYLSFALSPTYTHLSETRLCEITCHTYYVSLAELTCNLSTPNDAPWFGHFFYYWKLLDFSPREKNFPCPVAFYYLLWVHYFLFDSCHMFSDFDCLRHSHTSEFK